VSAVTAVEAPIAAVAVLLAALLGLAVGHLVNRAAGRFPWPEPKRSWSRRGDTPSASRVSPPQLHDRVGVAVRAPVVEVGTALLFALAALRFGLSAELPAFLFLAAAGVLLAVIDLQHHLLPNRIVLPSIGIGAVLLLLAAVAAGEGEALVRAVLGAVVLFGVFLVLALISPSGLGMGDVKLAALIGLYLGWIGWSALVAGAAGGFVIQAVVALALLAGRRIGLRGELPFGPAMLLGAAVAIGWSDAILR
jgi:leader peptidase (prepilin peptidase)/N-methyltransferase